MTHARPCWSTAWSYRRAAARSDLCDLGHLRGQSLGDLQQMMVATFEGPKPPGLSLEVVVTKRQSACLLERQSEAVVLFDLAQARILKRLLELVCNDVPYDETARLLAAAAGLAVSDESPELCASLLGLAVPEQAEYVHGEAQIAEYYGHLRSVLPRILFAWHGSLTDGFLLAHEVSHFLLTRPDALMTKISSDAEAAFDFALEQVCYERQPNFAEIAQHGGILIDSPEGLATIRRDLETRRAHYESDRASIVEEIACDAYGLHRAARTHEAAWKTESDDLDVLLDGYMRLAQTYFLLFALSDLHQAMLKRAKLSVSAGIESSKPGHIADMHFRKTALVYTIASQAFEQLPEQRRAPDGFLRLLHDLVPYLGRQKQAVDALIVIPVTRVIKAHIRQFEQSQGGNVPPLTGDGLRARGIDLRNLLGSEWMEAVFTPEGVDRLSG